MMSNQNKLKCVIFILLFFNLNSWIFGLVEEPSITISSSVDKSRIHIGDLIIYSVTVSHDQEIKVEMPGLGANLGGFEIRDYHVQDPKKEKDKIISQVDYTISTFFTGEFEIPPLTVQYVTSEDTTKKNISTEKIKIVVESVKPSEAGDIRDVKPPVAIPRDWWYVIRWFILGGGIIFLAVFIYYFYRRIKAGKGLLPQKDVVQRPPHEIAIEALNRLCNSDYFERGDIKQFYIEISEIIRQYIGGRYFVVAMEMTTMEVLVGLNRIGIEEENYRMFETFLECCDLVKFAKYRPTEKENEEIIVLAYGIVKKTKIVIEESNSQSKEEIEDEEIVESEEVGSVMNKVDVTSNGSQPSLDNVNTLEPGNDKQIKDVNSAMEIDPKGVVE